MPRVERVHVEAPNVKIPGPVPYEMHELRTCTYEVIVSDTDTYEDVQEIVEALQARQRGDLARQEAILRKKWSTRSQGDVRRSAPPAPAKPASGPSEKQLAFYADLKKDIEKATGQPITTPVPESFDEMTQELEAMNAERQRLRSTGNTAWSGHDNPDYPKGSEMAGKDRRCSYEHCPGKQGNLGRAIAANEWDWSIRNQGKPLCRECQKTAPSA